MAHILVIGEGCLDKFVYCTAARLAPDVPVPVLVKQQETQNDGMALNLCRNIQALQGTCEVWTNHTWPQVTKTRFVDTVSNHLFIRLDAGEELITRIDLSRPTWRQELHRYDVIAISDYNKGFLTYEDIEAIASAHPRVFLDTKKRINMMFSSCAYIKINTPEYTASKDFLDAHPEFASKLVVTAGAQGCYYQQENFPVQQVQIRDVSGAGDTFFAGLLVTYVETQDIRAAIRYANVCASSVVQHKGVTTVTNK